MIPTLLVTLLLVVAALYCFGLPMYRKRPVLVTPGMLRSFIIIFCCYALTLPLRFSLLLLVFLALLFFVTVMEKFWIVIGITKDNLIKALQSSCTGVQMPYNVVGTTVAFQDPTTSIHLYPIAAFNVSLIRFSLTSESKKQKLLTNVFRKFIDNYPLTL